MPGLDEHVTGCPFASAGVERATGMSLHSEMRALDSERTIGRLVRPILGQHRPIEQGVVNGDERRHFW